VLGKEERECGIHVGHKKSSTYEFLQLLDSSPPPVTHIWVAPSGFTHFTMKKNRNYDL
jgi:hypothetical protein